MPPPRGGFAPCSLPGHSSLKRVDKSPQAGMQIRQQIDHLFIAESPCKARHHSFAGKDHPAHFRICCRCATRQRGPFEHAMQIRRHFLQRKIIVLMAMRAPRRIEVLTFSLLRGELWHGMASFQHGAGKCNSGGEKHCACTYERAQPAVSMPSVQTVRSHNPSSPPGRTPSHNRRGGSGTSNSMRAPIHRYPAPAYVPKPEHCPGSE